MKTIITALLLTFSLQFFSQNVFLKRKYTKGSFIERVKKLKQPKEHKQNSTNHSSVITSPLLVTEMPCVVTDSLSCQAEPLAVTSATKVDSSTKSIALLQKEKMAVKTYHAIVKHNTIYADTNALYSSITTTYQNNISIKKQEFKIQNKSDTEKHSELKEFLRGFIYFLVLGLLILGVISMPPAILAIVLEIIVRIVLTLIISFLLLMLCAILLGGGGSPWFIPGKN